MTEILDSALKAKQQDMVVLISKAMNIVNKYITKYEQSSEQADVLLVSDLKKGLKNLQAGINLITTNEMWFKEIVQTPSVKRGGFGALSRGFGEFLWQGEDWQNEIMDAVDKIEDYYRDM